MSRANQRGQAILLVVVAMGIFLIGALGLAIDGSQLYGQRKWRKQPLTRQPRPVF